MKFDESDVSVTYYNPDERANSWKFDPYTGCCAKHNPTGLEFRSGLHKTKEENRISALYGLRLQIESLPDVPVFTDVDQFSMDQLEKDMANGVIVSSYRIKRLVKYARKLEKDLLQKNSAKQSST